MLSKLQGIMNKNEQNYFLTGEAAMSTGSMMSLLRRQAPVTPTNETHTSMLEVSVIVVDTESVTVENLTNLKDSTLAVIANKKQTTMRQVGEDMVWMTF